MTTKDNGGAATCAWCEEPSHIRQGRILLCVRHYRLSGMRARARRDGKHVPTLAELEALAKDMTCIGCRRQMTWLRLEGASSQVTLQHDRCGSIRLLCLACNTRHAQHPHDTFYTIKPGFKRCPDCDQTLPLAAFATDRSRPIGVKSYCRKCSSARNKEWRSHHASA